MSMKKHLGMLAAFAMMSAQTGNRNNNPYNDIPVDDIPVDDKQSKPPKGCKEYWFNKNGGFSNGGNSMRKDEAVFYCHASNDKNAKKKFNNWESKNKTT